MKVVIIRYLLLLMMPLHTTAQEVFIRAEYPRVVNVGEQFTVSWTINTGGGEFTAPPFSGFYKLMGPHTSYSSSTQIMNGKISQQTSYTYTYYLQATDPGKFVIPPALIKVKGKEYQSDSVYIEVVGSPSLKQTRPGVQKSETEQPVAGPDGDLFVRLIPDRTELYSGEPLVVSLKIYSRINISGRQDIKYPDFSGFIREDLDTPPLTSLERENVNGVIFGTGVIQQILLFPQISGEITINPVEVTALIQQRIGEPDPFFGDFFARYASVPKVLATLPLKIKVKPLPPDKPADFHGVVGKISLSASLNKDTVNVNDALNLKITINGSGNLKLAGAPVIKIAPDIEIYDPKISENLKSTSAGATGQKTFEFVLIPRHHGDFTIPPVKYSYFNPVTKQYETHSTKEFRFHAAKSAEQLTPVTMFGGVTREDVKYLGKDIRFIKSVPGKILKTDRLLISARAFPWYFPAALTLFAVIVLLRREHVRRSSDIAGMRNRKAGRIARKRLSVASKCLKTGMTDRFYEELMKALWGYLSDKLAIPTAQMTRNMAVDKMKEKGIDESNIEKILSVIDKCEYARFAPSSEPSEAEIILEDASRFIKYVENNIG